MNWDALALADEVPVVETPAEPVPVDPLVVVVEVAFVYGEPERVEDKVARVVDNEDGDEVLDFEEVEMELLVVVVEELVVDEDDEVKLKSPD